MNNSIQKKFVIRLNSIEKVEELLQETYNLATNQINQLQEEINIIKNTTTLKDTDIDGKEKYGKTINNYLVSMQKAIDRKFEIAKFMGDIAKYNGNINKALDNTNANNSLLNLDKIRKAVNEINSGDSPEKYELKQTK